MAIYYIRSDGAGGDTGGDGSTSAPYGTVAEMIADIGSLSADDVVAIDTETNGPLLESWTVSNLTDVSFIAWPGTSQVRILNAALATVDIAHDIGGGDPFDTYKNLTTDLATEPTAVVEDWDTRIDSNSNRYGFIPENSVSIADLRTTRSWFWNGTRLFVSVPDGESAADKTYYAGLAGDTWRMTDTNGVTFTDFSWELATEPGNGNGYGLRLLGACVNVRLNNCNFDGCQYHHMGSVGTYTTGLTLNNCTFRTGKANNDSSFVIYNTSTTVGTSGVVLDACTFELVPWLDYDGNALEAGSIKGIAAHHGSGAAATQPRGIRIKNCNSYHRGDNPTINSYDFGFTAPNTNHTAPSDENNPEDYPIIVQDSTWRGNGVNVGGGANAECHIAFDRCAFIMDVSSVSSGMATSGHISVTCNATGSNSTLLLRSCTASAQLSDTNSRGVFAPFANGARLILENTTGLIIGAFSNSPCMFASSASAGLLRMSGCIFASDGDSPELLRGQLNLASALDTGEGNWYSTSLSSTMSAFNSVSRATWESTWDTDGKYDEAPTFTSNTTLEPADASKVKNASKPTGPTGINSNPYDGTFGAFQYGSAGGLRSRVRGSSVRRSAIRGTSIR